MPTAKGQRPAGKNNLVTVAVDDNMVFPLCVLLSSMSRNAASPFSILVGHLKGSLTDENLGLITEVAENLGIPVASRELESDPLFISQGHISPTTFTKFLLSDVIAESHLWIDADTVAHVGWDQLFDLVRSAPDTAELVVAQRGNLGNKAVERFDDPSLLAFNAGVLGWPDSPRRAWREALKDLDRVATQEQYLLNQLYSGVTSEVSEAYNTLTYRVDRVRPGEIPFILHYAGPHKPWHLHRSLSIVCEEYSCPWAQWFLEERYLFDAMVKSSLYGRLQRAQKIALTSPRFRKGRDFSGLNLVTALRLMGPLRKPVVHILRSLSSQFPRGTHPLHPKG